MYTFYWNMNLPSPSECLLSFFLGFFTLTVFAFCLFIVSAYAHFSFKHNLCSKYGWMFSKLLEYLSPYITVLNIQYHHVIYTLDTGGVSENVWTSQKWTSAGASLYRVYKIWLSQKVLRFVYLCFMKISEPAREPDDPPFSIYFFYTKCKTGNILWNKAINKTINNCYNHTTPSKLWWS